MKQQKSRTKKPLLSIKIVFVIGAVIVILFLVGSILPFATGFLYSIPYFFQQNDTNKELVQKETVAPTPIGAENIAIDCSDLWFVPAQLKNAVYACQNIYTVDQDTLVKSIPSSADRVILAGKHSDYNCPVTSEKVSDILNQCYKRAKFLDTWQFPKTSQILGIPLPTQKVHFTVVNSYEQAKEICMQAGLDSGAVICINDSVIYIPEEMLKERSSVLTAYEFERLGDEKITYKIRLVSPKNCPASHMHELQHFFDFQAYGKAAAWFEESLVALVQDMMYSDICPPGFSYENVKKEVNGQKTSLPNFDLFSLNTEVPLTSRVEDYAQGNQCRRGIDMQIARSLRQQKTAYLPALFSALKGRNGNTESDIAKAVWESTQRESDVKNFLLSNSCSF